jgi:autophagy-related protein 5
MANDREVLKVVWEGKLPARFVVESEENDIQANDVFYLMLPRVSYLSLVVDKLKKHFQKFIQKEEDIWFSYQSIPLKTHIPIGITYE